MIGAPVIILAITFIAIFAFASWVIGSYNSMIAKRNEVKNSFSQIGVQLKRRHDLIPNLVETVKGYSQHEQSTLENVIKARQQAVNISSSNDLGKISTAENQLTNALKSLFAVTEAYPDLKANTNFLALQEELTSTENRITYARQYYNDSVNDYNTFIQLFPNCIISSSCNFKPETFFEINSEDEKIPQVSFT